MYTVKTVKTRIQIIHQYIPVQKDYWKYTNPERNFCTAHLYKYQILVVGSKTPFHRVKKDIHS